MEHIVGRRRLTGLDYGDECMRRSRLRGLVSVLIILFVLWQFWQRVHFVFWVHIPWWALLLLIVAAIVALELVVERVLGDS
jgi:hypothetical protein